MSTGRSYRNSFKGLWFWVGPVMPDSSLYTAGEFNVSTDSSLYTAGEFNVSTDSSLYAAGLLNGSTTSAALPNPLANDYIWKVYVGTAEYTLYFLVGILGNGLLVRTFYHQLTKVRRGCRRTQSSPNLNLFVLAASDLLALLLCVPIYIAYIFQVVESVSVCRILEFVANAIVLNSTLVLTIAVPIERYIAICREGSHFSLSHSCFLCGAIATLCFGMSIPLVWVAGLTPYETEAGSVRCGILTEHKIWYTTIVVVIGISGFLTMFIMYSLIIHKVWVVKRALNATKWMSIRAKKRMKPIEIAAKKENHDVQTSSTQSSDQAQTTDSPISEFYKLRASARISGNSMTHAVETVQPSPNVRKRKTDLSVRQFASDIRLFLTMFIVTFFYLLTYIPSVMVELGQFPDNPAYKHFYVLNNTINFLIYGLVHKRLRSSMKAELLAMCGCKPKLESPLTSFASTSENNRNRIRPRDNGYQ